MCYDSSLGQFEHEILYEAMDKFYFHVSLVESLVFSNPKF